MYVQLADAPLAFIDSMVEGIGKDKKPITNLRLETKKQSKTCHVTYANLPEMENSNGSKVLSYRQKNAIAIEYDR